MNVHLRNGRNYTDLLTELERCCIAEQQYPVSTLLQSGAGHKYIFAGRDWRQTRITSLKTIERSGRDSKRALLEYKLTSWPTSSICRRCLNLFDTWPNTTFSYMIQRLAHIAHLGLLVSYAVLKFLVVKYCSLDPRRNLWETGKVSIMRSFIMSFFFFPPWRYSPNLGLGLSPWNSPFHFGFPDLRQSVGFLGRVISSSQGLSTCTQTQKNAHTSTNTKHPCPGWDSNQRSRLPS
jgi:hypothetical protein